MPFPETADEMKKQGYVFENDAVCKGCSEEIEWWSTPRGRKMPMNPMLKGTAPAVPHWKDCTEAPLFRGK